MSQRQSAEGGRGSRSKVVRPTSNQNLEGDATQSQIESLQREVLELKALLSACGRDLQETAQRLRVSEQERRLVEQERDAYQQEVFESDRHAAWLGHQRQMLMDRLSELSPAEPGQPLTDMHRQLEELRAQLSTQTAYSVELESWVTRAEDRATQR